MNEIANLFLGNGYGFGKYEKGYLFIKHPSDQFLLYLTTERMYVLTKNERLTVHESAHFTQEELDEYFTLDFEKRAAINWLRPLRVMLLCDEPEITRKNFIYFYWPTVDVTFTDEMAANTLVIYDRTTPHEKIEELKQLALHKGIAANVEFWSKIKFITHSDRMGYLAPKGCIDKTVEKYEEEARKCCDSGCEHCVKG